VKKKLKERKEKQKKQYDKGSRDLNDLQIGDTVLIQPVVKGEIKWKAGVIDRKREPRSYSVKTEDGVETESS
jgi:hypothetical protein